MKRRTLWLAGLLWFVSIWSAWGQAIVGPGQMNQCDSATFEVTINNASATQDACQLVISNEVPDSGFTYIAGSALLTLTETSESFAVDPTDGAWDIDGIRGTAYNLPPGETITLTFDLATDCTAVSGTDIVTVDFVDCSDPETPLQNASSTSVEILPGAIVITKEPNVIEASVGDIVTWTITVENTGLGWVTDVVVTDHLGGGLAFVSASDNGSNDAQQVTWSPTTTPGLATIAAGESVSLELSAEVVACEGLVNIVDASWGCDSGTPCFDTTQDEGTATASIALLMGIPNLSFTAPSITVPYCSGQTSLVLPIQNSGDGPARHVSLCADFGNLTVTNTQGGATYDAGCFSIPDIPAATTFDLTFDVAFAEDWCSGTPSGSPVYTLTYENDCGIEQRARPQFGTISGSGGPSLSAAKTGPVEISLGDQVTYDLTVGYSGTTSCGAGSTGIVTVTDDVPDGFIVVDAGGGTLLPSGDIEWTFDPAVDPNFATSVILEVPTDCGFCYNEFDNVLTAVATDCCGCQISATATAHMVIECDLDVTSELVVSPASIERCGDSVTFTDTHVFDDVADLDGVSFGEFSYGVLPGNGLIYVSGTLEVTIDGAPTGFSETDNTPTGSLDVALSSSDSVRGHTLVFTWEMQATEDASPACGGAGSFYVWTTHDLGPDAPGGACTSFYETTPLVVQPPGMSLSMTGIPTVQDECATYDVTLTLSRTTSPIDPYDVRLVLSGISPYALDLGLVTCGGEVSPSDGTGCTSPIETADTLEWRFGDGFSAGATATITFPVTVPCGGPLLDLSAVALFDDLCHDDETHDDLCSVSAGDAAAISVSAETCIQVTPETIYAKTNHASFSICVLNAGNGTAHNAWVDASLGTGLVYVSSSIDDPSGAVESPNQDHSGSSLNGTSWTIDELAPGEERKIVVTVELIGCADMTFIASTSWGCNDDACQTPKADSATLVVPPSSVVATSFSPTPVPMCSDNQATVTIKNAGVTTVYELTANVTIDDGLTYLGNAEVQLNGGTWSSIPDPSGVPGPELTWTSVEVTELASLAPKDIVKIRFDYAVGCTFDGGELAFQAGYESPCRREKTSNIGRFTIGLTPAEATVTVRQVSPAPGEAIDCGGEATWEIDVENVGAIAVPVVQVVATLDDGLVLVSSTGDPTYGPADGGAASGQSVTWELVDLPVDAVATLSITATTASSGLDCEALDVFVDVVWGCGLVDGVSLTNDADCLASVPTSISISGVREPPVGLSATFSPGEIEGCDDSATLTLEITNASETASISNIDVEIELPSDLSYAVGSTQIDCGAGYSVGNDPAESGSTLTWYDINLEGGDDDLCVSILPGEAIRLQFDVDASCYFASAGIPITIRYYDCCGLTQYTATTTPVLTSQIPNLTVAKTPAVAGLDCNDPEDEVNWTIRVTNSGAGTADVVRIEDTLGADLEWVSGGTQLGSDPQAHGWEFGPLASGAFYEVTLVARLAAPPEDCDVVRRTNTARATWGCGTFDGNPNTTAEYTCASGVWRQDTAEVQIANLTLGEADIVPIFTCSGDGVGSGGLQVAVRNTNDGAISEDFAMQIDETTTGWSVSDTFVGLGGTLPLAGGSSQVLTVSGWPVSCIDCAYHFDVTLDIGSEICECAEGNNTASLDYTLTSPNLSVDSTDLSVTCAGDGTVRIAGTVSLVNTGCGDPLTTSVPMRFTIYDAAGCSGNVVGQFTTTFSGVDLAAGGDAQAFSVNRVVSFDACGTCVVSILVEADYDDSICECSGGDNSLCVGPFDVATPDLTVIDIDFSSLSCVEDAISGQVLVTIENTGCGAAEAFDVALSGDGCLSFSTQRPDGLAASAQAVVSFPVESVWADCGDCSCTFTATIDGAAEICECDGTNNQLSAPYDLMLPDLEVSAVSASLVCEQDGRSKVLVDATIANTGCGDVNAAVAVRITLYDGAGCTGTVVDQWTEEIGTISLGTGATQAIDLADRSIDDGLCAGDCGFSILVEVDSDDRVCECDGTDNAFCLSPVLLATPDLLITEIDPRVDCRTGTAEVVVTLENTGCGDATGVVVDLTSAGCGLSLSSDPIDLTAGASEGVTFTYAPNCGDWNCDYTVTIDDVATVCECDGTNNASGHTPYPGDGSIGDTVWCDANANGVQGEGEDGIPGVIVVLEGDLDGDGQTDYSAEQTTASDGTYLFTGLPAGTYTVTVDDTTLPEGLEQTYDADGLGTPHASELALGVDEDNLDQDFGYRGTGSIGDTVWFDANANGVQDEGEDGIPGVTVTLQGDVDADGVSETLTALTASDGTYLFEYLPAGTYTVTVDDTTLPEGLEQTYDADSLGTPHASEVGLAAGEDNRDQDFGYRGTGSIGDTVWFDANANGVQDEGEDGIPGVTVTLQGDVDADGVSETLTAVTAPDGTYLFEYLPAGTYTVTVDDTTLPEGLEQTYDADGLGTPHASEVGLAAGEDNRDQDFGYRGTGSIGDTVWFDANGNGIQDEGEDGIPGVTVTLQGDVDADGVSETLTALTASDGTYLFEYLPAGTYTVTVDDTTLPEGLEQTYDADGLGTPHASEVGLAAGEDNRDQDFGYRGTGSIGDTVWFDANGNGIQDEDEDGIPGVTVTLQGDVDADGVSETLTAVTAPDGTYLFEFLPAGAYTVTVDDTTLPEGLEQTYDADGLGTPHASEVGLAAGEDNRDQDFGYRGTGSIGDTVWFDANANGVQDEGEDGIPGVTVTLQGDVDADGVSETLTAVTAPDGTYLFEFLPAGTYTVTVDDTTLPEGLEQTYDADSLGTPHASEVGLAAGEDNRDQDFGYRGTGSIGDTVWFDANGNGIQDEDEDGIPGVTVTLQGDVDADGVSETLTALTASDGTYLFEYLPAGTYTVTVDDTTLPEGLEQTYDADGLGTPHASEVGLAAGEDNRDQDFGYSAPALSVDKTVVDILRAGESLGANGPVEPNDVIVYRFVVRNVGAATAYDVDIHDMLPDGVVTETDAPGDDGSYVVTAPAASGSLGLADGQSTFETSIGATLAGGASLTLTYSTRATSGIAENANLVNIATATGNDPSDQPIEPENPELGDTSDDDPDDPDADDTGTAIIAAAEPALVTTKTVQDIVRRGESVGTSGPVEAGDTVRYALSVQNVGNGSAEDVNVSDVLPGPFAYVPATSFADWPSGTSTSDPTGGAGPELYWNLSVTLAAGEMLSIVFDAQVSSDVEQGKVYVNRMTAVGVDGAGTPILADNSVDVPGDIDEDDASDVELAAVEPGLSVDKEVIAVLRDGADLGPIDVAFPNDVVRYRYTIRNVGSAVAYDVEFIDQLPAGFEIETDSPYADGTYAGSAPAASGTLGLSDGASTFSTSIGATLAAGGTLTAQFDVRITTAAEPGVPLDNVATATAVDGAGSEIPAENSRVGDVSDDDPDDADADDTGTATIRVGMPALSVDKETLDVLRNGLSIGAAGPVEPGDLLVYAFTIRNVGTDTAYNVGFIDRLPAGVEIETGYGDGTYSVDDPLLGTTAMGLADGATGAVTASLGARIAAGGTLTAVYRALVTSAISDGEILRNEASATGRDVIGDEIPLQNALLGDVSDDDPDDPDADDTGIESIVGAEPALVTEKTVAEIRRGGESIGALGPVEPGDVITYAFRVTNVGSGTAYGVDVTDTLPAAFSYLGATTAVWPSGSSSVDPSGVPGPTLSWPLSVTLGAGEFLVLQFEARVSGRVSPTVSYVNIAAATGLDGAGTPIPANQVSSVPTDDDPDDADDVALSAAVPALVTDKEAFDILRDGTSVGADDRIRIGDVVAYRLSVSNVGGASAYGVTVVDLIPSPFRFVSGSSILSWPGGTDGGDPMISGSELSWSLGVALAPEDALVVDYRVLVEGPLTEGTYDNVMRAAGSDGAGRPIPPDMRSVVPADGDPDDSSRASLQGGVPALVTEKRIVDILHDGESVVDAVVEPGDIVVFELVVQNVGVSPAIDVVLFDDLPAPLSYISGSSRIDWSFGSSDMDPVGAPGPSLTWDLGIVLDAGREVRASYEVLASADLLGDQTLVNRLWAIGKDSGGSPIPPDRRVEVPDDDDPDDASEVLLVTRASRIAGAAGSILDAPILRKTVERVAGTPCAWIVADSDHVWFQTDIAEYAAAELARLAVAAPGTDFSRETLLPTWWRTAANRAEATSFGTVMSVEAASGLGVSLALGPRIVADASWRGEPAELGLERLLDRYAAAAGLAERPRGERWIYLPFAGGDPRFVDRVGDAWTCGTWAAEDRRIVGSALGMSLLAQVETARRLLLSEQPLDRYTAYVLIESMLNLVATIDGVLEFGGSSVPAVLHAAVSEEGPVSFSVVDSSFTLFDSLSIVWGLASFARFFDETAAAWSETVEADSAARRTAVVGMSEVLEAIARSLRARDGSFLASTASEEQASLSDVGLLLAALADVAPLDGSETVLRTARAAAEALAGRTTIVVDYSLRDAVGAIRGLLAAADVLGDPSYIDLAGEVFSEMNDRFFDEQLGVYVDSSEEACLTPLDLGLVVGALRELREVDDRFAEAIDGRLASHLLTVTGDAALDLTFACTQVACTQGCEAVFVGDGTGQLVATPIVDAPLGVAPVLRRELCLDRGVEDAPCDGWLRDDAVFYQTDWAMYAGWEIQAAAFGAEDYADANLLTVLLHSGLGESFDGAVPESDAPGADVSPICAPYAGGSPVLFDESGGWDPRTFEPERTGSAMGMTILRMAQEIAQSLDEEDPSSETQYRILLLLQSTIDTLAYLEAVIGWTPAALGAAAIPHGVNASRSGGEWAIDVVDPTSRLFDQAALLWGLSEFSTLIGRTGLDPYFVRLGRSSDEVRGLVEVIDSVVVSTLAAHYDPGRGTFVDRIEWSGETWRQTPTVRTESLAVVLVALNARALADSLRVPQAPAWILAGTWNLLDELTEPDGTVHVGDPAGENACDAADLTAHLAALRALIAVAAADERATGRAQAIFDRIERSFGDSSTGFYLAEVDEWRGCITPFDLGLLVGGLSDLAAASEPSRAARIRNRLDETFRGLADVADMQLSSVGASLDGTKGAYAPVFDREVCLEPAPGVGSGRVAEPGDRLRYTITADNPTESTWTALRLTDILPPDVEILDASPGASFDERTLVWTFDELEPGGWRTWTIDTRLPNDTERESIENCATLAYHDVDGVPQPDRRACAMTSLGEPSVEVEKIGQWVDLPEYDTAEAMYLTSVLAGLRTVDWRSAERGISLALANLGILLGESKLGLSVFESGDFVATMQIAELFESIVATGGGIAVVPDLTLIPSAGGTPLLAAEQGFVAKSEKWTSAAIGQTLAGEATALEIYNTARDRLGTTLSDILWTLIDAQLRWLDGRLVQGENGAGYLGHDLAPGAADEEPYSTFFDQASLLYGLSAIRVRQAAVGRATDAADRLIEVTLDRLAAHQVLSTGDYADRLPGDEEGARWRDLEVAARALSQLALSSSSRATVAGSMLRDLGERAMTGDETSGTEEMARIRTLLHAAETLENREALSGAISAWEALRAEAWNPFYGLFVDSADAAVRSRDAAVFFDTLAVMARRLPEEAARRTGEMDRAFERLFDRARLQLTRPGDGYWSENVTFAGPGISPVFGERVFVNGWTGGERAVSGAIDGRVLRFTIDLAAESGIGTLQSLLIDCPIGLTYVPGSAWFAGSDGTRRAIDPRIEAPLIFRLPDLRRRAEIEYLMLVDPDAEDWSNEVRLRWVDDSGRIHR